MHIDSQVKILIVKMVTSSTYPDETGGHKSHKGDIIFSPHTIIKPL